MLSGARALSGNEIDIGEKPSPAALRALATASARSAGCAAATASRGVRIISSMAS
jgi:hypothetical protein